MIFRDFQFVLIVTVFLSFLVTDAIAMGVQAEPIFDSIITTDDKQKSDTVSDSIKHVLGAMDIGGDAIKVHGSDLGVENTKFNSSLNESTVEISAVLPPIFRGQESINRSAQSILGVQQFSHANLSEGAKDIFSYKNLMDEVQAGLGDGGYRKLVWMYYDLKDLDNRIYFNMIGYDLSGSNFFGKLQQFIGVDERISAMIVFKNSAGIVGNSIGVENSGNQDINKSSKVVLDFSQPSFASKGEVDTGRFQVVLKHLTIKNIIYGLLILMGGGMVWRMFSFFVRQGL